MTDAIHLIFRGKKMIKQQQLSQIINSYIDREIAPLSSGMNSLQQLLFGFQLGIIKRKSQAMLKDFLGGSGAKMLHLVEGDDVDVDTLYAALSDAMNAQGSVEVLGIKLTNADVNKLYSMIKEQMVYETTNTPNS